MEEIKIYLDSNKTEEIFDKVTFDPVPSGEKSIKKLYIFNTIEFPINLKFNLIGDNININQTIDRLLPGQMKYIEFELDPKITLMKPITAKLEIKLNYIIR